MVRRHHFGENPMVETTNNIARFREARGWSRPDLAVRMGTSPQQVERLEKGQRKLSQEWMTRFAQVFGVDVAEIIKVSADALPPSNAMPFRMEGASQQRMRADLPIWGTALGAPRVVDGEAIEQTMLNQGDVIGYAKRPTILDGRADAYGLYVQGSSMAPVYTEGAMLLVERKRPPRVGDDVVVYLRPEGDEDDGSRSAGVLVKRLVRRSASYIELEQFTPAITFRIAAEKVLRIDRVMTLADLLS